VVDDGFTSVPNSAGVNNFEKMSMKKAIKIRRKTAMSMRFQNEVRYLV
jgi:hypothetical protein